MNETDEMIGAPSEPVPDRGVKEIRSRAHIEGVGRGENIISEPQL